MIVTVSLSDDEVAGLEAVAEREGRSLDVVARAAILEYVAGWARERDRLIDLVLTEDAKLLRRLGTA
ncbi:MAG: hypothetical protein JWO12_1201 [Frankiales bacterium]|jgi:predicted transcriptional regulator|nr:hypothetical protein [Frankiales bacterium]